MKEDDQSKANDEKPIRLTIYKPEDQVFQKLHLCEYLGELYEAAEEENEHAAEKKKDFRRHARKECELHKSLWTTIIRNRRLRVESKHNTRIKGRSRFPPRPSSVS